MQRTDGTDKWYCDVKSAADPKSELVRTISIVMAKLKSKQGDKYSTIFKKKWKKQKRSILFYFGIFVMKQVQNYQND